MPNQRESLHSAFKRFGEIDELILSFAERYPIIFPFFMNIGGLEENSLNGEFELNSLPNLENSFQIDFELNSLPYVPNSLKID